MQAAVAKADFERQPDDVAHCTAAGLIARYCSVTEAGLASIGKEIRDLFTAGDAQWRDLMSDKRGVRLRTAIAERSGIVGLLCLGCAERTDCAER